MDEFYKQVEYRYYLEDVRQRANEREKEENAKAHASGVANHANVHD